MTLRLTCLALLFCLASFTVQAATADAPPAMVPNSFADLAARVQDAVVNVSTTQKLKPNAMRGMPGMQMPEFPPGSPFQDFFEEFFNGQNGMGGMAGPNGGPAPQIQSLGSGFIIDGAKGIIVTNNHVIDDADEVQVILHDDTKLKATIVGRDKETDLAVLKVTPTKTLTSVTWGDSDAMRVGDWVLAVGNPFGLGGTVTSGIISARQRNINAGRYDDFIQTDASINRGNSGGPMFNMRGEVIGINTAIFSPSGGSVGIGFAIPSNLSKPVIDQLLKFGTTHRGWIGVRIQEVTPEIAESIGMKSGKGAMVASMTSEGPAAKAGLKQGDVIESFGGKDITEMRLLPRLVADAPTDKASPIKVFRPGPNGGKELTLSITPGALEKAEKNGLLADEDSNDKDAAPNAVSDVAVKDLNLRVATLNDMLRQKYQLNKDVSGVVVTDVTRQSDAAEKGVSTGDVILEVNQKAVATPDQLNAAIKAAKAENKNSVLLLVNTQNNLRFIAVKLGAAAKNEDKADDSKPKEGDKNTKSTPETP